MSAPAEVPAELDRLELAQLIERYPKVLEVLDKHGVHFCAGCFITLTADARKAAGYHAVEDKEAFLQDLRRAAR